MTLAVRDLHAYYGESHVLQGVSLDVGEREAVALLGRNGAGKTTTINAIVGFVRPRGGTVRVGDQDVTAKPPHRVAAAGVALVPQGRRVFSDLTVRENLTIAARGNGGGWDLARVLELFPSLGRRLANRGDELSGGEQQMVAIGRALLRDPVLLLLDEPSEGLAPKLVNEVGDALVRLRESGLSLLLVEQNLALATRVAQRVYVMNKGTIVFSGTTADLAAAGDVEARYLGI
ncbi:MAG TPA: ABC transporter ATP-binding protein [Candidatus Limnocylindria bacterium]|jgi:branched-chain amino acid transport system ATP-binding protein|nr:ABC transporter ATP-binding protein [Candidatus Limnocylindria bacterium]